MWVTNDWDAPPTLDQALVGARVAWSGPHQTLGVSSTLGPFGTEDPWQLMVDLDATWTVGRLTLLGEANLGHYDKDSLWSMGGLFKVHYAFTDWLGATLRYDYLDRRYGTLVHAHSATGAVLFGISDHFGALVEVRSDLPVDADPTLFAAAELTASF